MALETTSDGLPAQKATVGIMHDLANSESSAVKIELSNKKRKLSSQAHSGRDSNTQILSRAAVETTDLSLDSLNLGKKVAKLEADLKMVNELLSQEYKNRGELFVATTDRARLRKKTFDEQMVLRQINMEPNVNGQEV
ncbi:hypothetical protein IFR05_005732 [Cadophora sp. M221]|nr:hypothetical protein IFR05_005732 [Cadophora sp. M221]